MTDEADTPRYTYPEIDPEVVVVDIHRPAPTGPALIGSVRIVAGVDSANADPVVSLNDLDVNLAMKVRLAMLNGDDLDFVSGGSFGIDVAVYGFDFNHAAGSDRPMPAKHFRCLLANVVRAAIFLEESLVELQSHAPAQSQNSQRHEDGDMSLHGSSCENPLSGGKRRLQPSGVGPSVRTLP